MFPKRFWRACGSRWPKPRGSTPAPSSDVLDDFRRHAINLTNIGSRPSQKRNFDYYFFTDMVGHADDEKIKSALEEARHHCLQLAVLGSFPRAAETL